MKSGTNSLSNPSSPKSCPYPPEVKKIALQLIVFSIDSLVFIYFNPYIVLLVSFFNNCVTFESYKIFILLIFLTFSDNIWIK